MDIRAHKEYSNLFPVQRGHVEIDYFSFFKALQYIAENGCKWRALPQKFGNWNSIYRRFRYWIDRGIFERIPLPGWWIFIPQRRHRKLSILPKHRKQIDCFVHFREFS